MEKNINPTLARTVLGKACAQKSIEVDMFTEIRFAISSSFNFTPSEQRLDLTLVL